MREHEHTSSSDWQCTRGSNQTHRHPHRGGADAANTQRGPCDVTTEYTKDSCIDTIEYPTRVQSTLGELICIYYNTNCGNWIDRSS